FEVARRDVEQEAEPTRRPLEVPDVAYRRGKLDMAHALAPHLGARDFHATLVAHDPLVADALVFAAVALPVLRGTEDALAEEAVLFRLQRAVIDGFRLRHLSVRPGANLLGRGKTNTDPSETIDFEHRFLRMATRREPRSRVDSISNGTCQPPGVGAG